MVKRIRALDRELEGEMMGLKMVRGKMSMCTADGEDESVRLLLSEADRTKFLCYMFIGYHTLGLRL